MDIEKEYFEWMVDLVCKNRFAETISYRKLLTRLHEIEFTYSIPKDGNRAEDGIDLRYRFTYYNKLPDDIMDDRKPCSVLEMMLALAIRCEESIMDDPSMGDRTSQWFWGMIVNLGLGAMSDSRFDIRLVDEIVNKFLDRKYERNGKGGLFKVNDPPKDLRKVEIWFQMCWYLDTLV